METTGPTLFEKAPSPGQVAYEAYGEFVGWKSFTGHVLPEWQDQRHSLRQAWEKAAEAVINKAFKDSEKSAGRQNS